MVHHGGEGVATGGSTSVGEYGCSSSSPDISVAQEAETRHELGPGSKLQGLPHINSLLLAMPHLLKISQLLSSLQQGPAIQMCEPVGMGTLCIQTVADGLASPPHLSRVQAVVFRAASQKPVAHA